jgi:hypothetical protein
MKDVSETLNKTTAGTVEWEPVRWLWTEWVMTTSVTRTQVSKSKAVPLNRVEATVGTEGTDPTHSWNRRWMEVSGQRHGPAALYPRGKDHRYQWRGGWMSTRAGLGAQARRKILFYYRGSNPGRPVRTQTLHWLSYQVHDTGQCHGMKAANKFFRCAS